MPTLSPSALRTLTVSELTTDQRSEAYGRYSSSKPSSSSNHLDVWFGPNATTNIKQVIATGDDTAALLFLVNDTFTVVSSVNVTLDADSQPYLTGHLGDKLATITPTKLKVSDMTSEAFVLLPDGNDNLQHLKATAHLASDVLGEGDNQRTFLGEANLDNAPDLTNMRVAKLPTAVPLPYGHGIDSTSVTDGEGLNKLVGVLGGIDARLVTWMHAMLFSLTNFESVSLHHESLHIPAEYFAPLVVANDQSHNIQTSIAPLDPNFAPAKQVISRLTTVQDANNDAWIQANKDICEPITTKFAPMMGGNPAPRSNNDAPTQINVTVPKSSENERKEVKKQKSLAMAKLLCGHVDDDTDEFVPAVLNEDFVGLVEEGSAKEAMRAFITMFSEHLTARSGNCGSVIEFHTDMPLGVINQAFVAAFTSGHFTGALLHEQDGMVGQNLSIFSFLKANEDSSGYKRARDLTNQTYNEAMVGESPSNATKISTNLFSSGDQRTYTDMLVAIANLHAAVSFMIDPAEAKACRALHVLEALFSQLASSEFKAWFNYHSKGSVTWLCHGILVDVHNVFRQIVLVASSPTNQRAVIVGKTLKASDVLVDLDTMLASVTQKWNITTSNNTIGDYNSEPSTWRSMAPPETPAPKKKPRPNITPDGNDKNGSWGRLDGAPPPTRKASNPDFGLIKMKNQLSFRKVPKMSSGKNACREFVTKGLSCVHGRTCKFEHISTNSNQADVMAMYQWAQAADGVEWLAPTPKRTLTKADDPNSDNGANGGSAANAGAASKPEG